MPLFFKNKKSVTLDERLTHIAFIMDGNGRWATSRGLPREQGHRAGAKAFQSVAQYCETLGLKAMTVYAFSTENWKRPKDEVDGIMNLLRKYLKDSTNFKAENIKLRFIGELSVLPEDIRELIKQAELDSSEATGLTVYMAVNYGGRDELVHAVKRIAERVKTGEMNVDDITEDTVSANLYADCPDPDFIIRPSGEYRLSNFLTWQSAYAEFWYSDVLWPDFSPKDLDKAIDDFNKRNRRFGGV